MQMLLSMHLSPRQMDNHVLMQYQSTTQKTRLFEATMILECQQYHFPQVRCDPNNFLLKCLD